MGFIWAKKQTVFWVVLVISIFNNGLGAAHHQFKIQLLTSLNSTDTTTTMKLYVPAHTIVKFIYLYSEFMVKTINIPMQVVVVQFHFWWFMAMILDWVLEHSIEDDQSLDLFARKLCLMLLLHVGIKEIVGVRLISLSLSSCFFEQLITSFFPSTLIHFHKRPLEFLFFPTAIFFFTFAK